MMGVILAGACGAAIGAGAAALYLREIIDRLSDSLDAVKHERDRANLLIAKLTDDRG